MPLVLVTPPTTLPNEHEAVKRLFDTGLERLHVRKPEQSIAAHRGYLKNIPPEYRNRVVLHDFHELVQEFDLGGVHFRERQLPVLPIVAPPRRTVSIGFHHAKLTQASRGEVDYCFLSPIFSSISKAGYCPPPELRDHTLLAKYLEAASHPVLALGGVSTDTFGALADMGFAGVAMLGAIWGAADPVAALEQALDADAKTNWRPLKRWPFVDVQLATVKG